MNRLTSQQRKLTYLGGIVVLMIPVIWLGMPASNEAGSGGLLAKWRQPAPIGYDLGETTLGDVDPSSATMNLVLLGLRGVATNLLWMEALDNKDKKNWAQLRANVESIILLQPHYLSVWKYQAWNLAYNVSVEWDGVADRYYWLKEGAKFSIKGTERNERFAELYWDTGTVVGHKLAHADEWKYFRKYFNKRGYPLGEKFAGDPDKVTWPEGYDLELNPDRKDNYLVARDWFLKANEQEVLHGQHQTMRMLFRQYPAKSLLEFASARQREGSFDEKTQIAWEDALNEWTNDYGREKFSVYDAKKELRFDIQLDADESDVRALAEDQGVDEALLALWTSKMQNICNYRYWRMRAFSEKETEAVAAHRELYQGRQRFREGRHEVSLDLLASGLQKFENVLLQFDSLLDDNSTIEEVLTALLYWRSAHRLTDRQLPENYPLKSVWEKQQSRVPEISRQLRLDAKMNSRQ